jgi:hypothetical protein
MDRTMSTSYLPLSFDMNERHLRATREEILTRYAKVFDCVAEESWASVSSSPPSASRGPEETGRALEAKFTGKKENLDALLMNLGLHTSEWAVDEDGEYRPIGRGFTDCGPDWMYTGKDGDVPEVLHNMTTVSASHVNVGCIVRARWEDGWIEGHIVGVDKKWVTLRVTAFSHNTTGCDRGMLTRIIVPGLQVDDTEDRIMLVESGYFGANSKKEIVEAIYDAKIDDSRIDYLRLSSF